MSKIYNEVHLTEKEFKKEFDAIIDSISEESSTIWIINHKVAFIPVNIYKELTELVDERGL